MGITWLLLALLAGGFVWLLWSLYLTREHDRAVARLEPEGGSAVRRIDTFPARYAWVAPVIGGAAFAAAILLWKWRVPYAVCAGALTGVLALLAEDFAAGVRVARMEQQLAEGIDIIVNALRAGSSLQTALESVRLETREPFRSEIESIVARLRIGEDPRGVIRELGVRVPLESMRLFSHVLMVHWASGGSLAGTLLMIGRTLRDRMEVTRRVRAQAVESQISVIAIMGVSYGTGLVIYFSNPVELRAFLLTSIGMWITVGATVLQAVGIYWIWRMSQVRF